MRIGLLMLLDALLISASLLMGLQVYYDMHAPAAHILHVWRSLPLLIVSTVALLHMMGFYRGILKYAGVDLLLQIACGTLGGTGITYLVSFLCYSIRREPNIFLMPRPVYLVQWLLLMVMLAASRFVIKVAQGHGLTATDARWPLPACPRPRRRTCPSIRHRSPRPSAFAGNRRWSHR